MNSPAFGLHVASAIFALTSIGLLGRLLSSDEIQIDEHRIGFWPLLAVAGVCGALGIWLARLAGLCRDAARHPSTHRDTGAPPRSHILPT